MTTKLSRETTGMYFGVLGIIGFSLTLPATRIAVIYMDPVLVGFGRAIVAGVLASLLLLFTKQRLPDMNQVKSLIVVALGVIIGFPLLSAYALQSAPASHGALIIGIIPLATVVAGVVRGGEKPSFLFWMLSLAGCTVIILYALIIHGGSIKLYDISLVCAALSAAVGYAEGARLSRSMGGWRVISWALVISIPFILLPVIWVSMNSNFDIAPEGWLSFGYVSIVSQFLAFFAWYKGLAMGGIAKVGQVQLLQPLFTIVASALLIGEEIKPVTIITLITIGLIVAAGKLASVKQPLPKLLKP